MLELAKKVFFAFNENGVRYCNWKGTSKIEEALNGVSDIDILMSDDCCHSASNLLKETGFVKAKTQWVYRFKCIEDWIGFDSDTGKFLHIHLHYRMIAGHPFTMEYTLPWKDDVLANRILLENGVYTISAEWELLVFLIRNGIEYPNKKIGSDGLFKKSAIDEYNYIRGKADNKKSAEIISVIYDSDAPAVISLLKKSNFDKADFALLSKATKNVLKKTFIWRGWYSCLSKTRGFVDAHLSRHLRQTLWIPQRKTLPRGSVIAFLGQDGSGKSTVTTEIEKWLSWKLEVAHFYLGSGEEYYNPWRRRLIKRLNKSNSIISQIISPWLYFSDLLAASRYVLKTVRTAHRYANKGGTALLDRFPQVQYPGINDGPKIRAELLDRVPNAFKWIAQIYAKREELNLEKAVQLAPDVVIKLMLSPEESLRRKPFENKEMVEKKHDIIKSLTFNGSQVEIVDAEQDYNQEILQIKSIVWNEIQK